MPAHLVPILVCAVVGGVSSLLPGPCNLAIVDGVARGATPARTLALAFGGALGDATYATLGVVGAGRLIAAHPELLTVLQICTGVALIAVGLARLLRSGARATAAAPSGSARRGIAVGLGLVLANPATLGSWSVVLGALVGGASALDRAGAVLALGVGSFAAFALVGRAARGGATTGSPRLARFATVISVVLVGIGVASLMRVTHHLIAS